MIFSSKNSSELYIISVIFQVCYKMVDTFLEQADLPTFSDITEAVDVIVGPENAILQVVRVILILINILSHHTDKYNNCKVIYLSYRLITTGDRHKLNKRVVTFS